MFSAFVWFLFLKEYRSGGWVGLAEIAGYSLPHGVKHLCFLGVNSGLHSGRETILFFPSLWLFFLLLRFQHPDNVLSYGCYGSVLVFPAVLGGMVPGTLLSADLWWRPNHGFHLLVFWPSNWLSSGEWCAFILVPWFIMLISFFLFHWFWTTHPFLKYLTHYFTEYNGRASPIFLSSNESVNRCSPSDANVVRGDPSLLKCSNLLRI